MKRKQKPTVASAATQLRSALPQPFSALGNTIPLGGSEARLYMSLRESLPIIDAAITKLVRPRIKAFIACCISTSVRVSTLEVASSKIITGGSDTAARAMEINCRCP